MKRASRLGASAPAAIRVNETPSERRAGRVSPRSEIDRGLELVPAGFAGPQMPDATLADMLRPFRSEQGITALCAGSEVPGPGL